MTARPQLAAVLAALTDCREHEEQPSFWLSLDGCRLELVASDGAWFDAPRQPRAPEGRSVRRRWITTDPAEAWEVLQACDIIPLDYRGRFVCYECERIDFADDIYHCNRCGREVTADGHPPQSYPPSIQDLVAWVSFGFAARDNGDGGILAMEEWAQCEYPRADIMWSVKPDLNRGGRAAEIGPSRVVLVAPPL